MKKKKAVCKKKKHNEAPLKSISQILMIVIAALMIRECIKIYHNLCKIQKLRKMMRFAKVPQKL